MQRLIQDLRFALRGLIKRPGFALIAVMTLALGIGSSTAIFSVVDAAIIKGLPYQEPDRLYHMWERTSQKDFDQREFSYPDYQDYLQNKVVDIAAYTGGGTILNGNGTSERVFAPLVTANFFSVLGVQPIKGRTFQAGEDKQGGPQLAVITYPFWQSHFGGSENVVGQQLNLAGQSYSIIGVLPQSFQFAMRPADLFLPYQPTQNQLTRRCLRS
ncbi:MAG TPA: ABC transporter permease [Pyrinomonadaceae bacterium]|nr:ABC transporter permease [Pyrinomonadaceae bacterium]